ncbi:MAG: hypothetical protein KKI12_05230 [Proteobacteria bacterium]|nr:hypothetical protein [Pseudomonadota bacterium]MBU4287559.1 hypothetical protein [Pseudomonadota bacterium]MBU4415483.1 hypothetical protein [Pseudomonadota bacterium]MCG2758249.1 hypothetical protein [Desulfobacteraceae bacterium]
MKIWKLSVLNGDSHHWKASTYKGEVFVRAISKHCARLLSGLAFRIATDRETGETIAVNPWTQKNLVSCDSIEDERYKSTGEEEALFPK